MKSFNDQFNFTSYLRSNYFPFENRNFIFGNLEKVCGLEFFIYIFKTHDEEKKIFFDN